MNLTVHQHINIQTIKINSVSNSSVFQIGSAGIIKSLSTLSNTGGFTAPAPSLSLDEESFVPFSPNG